MADEGSAAAHSLTEASPSNISSAAQAEARDLDRFGKDDEQVPSKGELFIHANSASKNVSRVAYREEVLYRSFSVLAHVTCPSRTLSGSLKILERDFGDSSNLFDVHVCVTWVEHSAHSGSGISEGLIMQLSVDDFLALRFISDGQPHPQVILFGKQGKQLTTLSFVNGPDAAAAFISSLRQCVHMEEIFINDRAGQLYCTEAKSRMRSVVPSVIDGEDNHQNGVPDSAYNQSDHRRSPRETQHSRNAANIGVRRSRPRTGIMLLEQFAKITQTVRSVADDVSLAFNEERRRKEQERQVRERQARQRALDIYAVFPQSNLSEEDLPPHYILDRTRGVPLTRAVWLEMQDDRGAIMDQAVTRLAVFAGGLDVHLRRDAWPYLLGVYPWSASRDECISIEHKNAKYYKDMKRRWLELKSPPELADSQEITCALQQTAIADSVSSESEQVDTTRDAQRDPGFAPGKIAEQIRKDVVRTDRNVDGFKQETSRMLSLMEEVLNVFALCNREIGYCQGMSDLLAPLCYVLGTENESLLFASFEALMKRYSGNFRVDQSGMREQLNLARKLLKETDEELFQFFSETDSDFYCIFRWVIVCFKRELPFEATLRFWEILWSRRFGDDFFHVYVAVGILRAHRRQLLRLEVGAFDVLLRYVNDMSMRIDVDFAVAQGEKCYLDSHHELKSAQ